MRTWPLILIAMFCASCSSTPVQSPPEPGQKAPVQTKQDPMNEQLVRLDIPLNGKSTDESIDYQKLEDDLDAAAKKAGVGTLDGNEIGEKEYAIYMYGRDATKLAEVVKSALKGKALPKGCKLFLRHGGVKESAAKEETIALGN